MYRSIADFDGFSRSFREASLNRSLDYWADAVFVMLWLESPGVEKRFKGGVWLWAFWVLAKCLAAKVAQGRNKKCALAGEIPSTASYAFRLLATPAHHDSLVPILDQIPQEQRHLYGYDREDCEEINSAVKSGLSHSLSSLARKDSLRALVHSIRSARRMRRSLVRMPEHAGLSLPRDFTARLAELILREWLELAVLRKTPCPQKAVFLTYELIPESKAWVQWAREEGARVIHIMHGQRLPTYQVTMATDLLLFSKVDEQWFRERVDPQVRLWTIGHPRLEMLRREVGPPIAIEGPRLPRIAFFSQPAEGDYSPELRLRDWAILAGLKDRAEVRFRLHPRESKEIALRDLQNIGADFIELSEAGLKEDLAWCDAVASSWSTVSMEAAACGRGVFWTCSTPEKYKASQELRDAGVGALIRNAGDWATHLEAWDAGSWIAPVMLPEHRLRELGMIGDMDRPWLERLGIE